MVEKRRCSCGGPWKFSKITLKSGREVRNIWCERCDGKASGITAVPRPGQGF